MERRRMWVFIDFGSGLIKALTFTPQLIVA
jgi:hypothetical protein